MVTGDENAAGASSVVMRGISILVSLENRSQCTLTEISAETGLAPATAHRILEALIAAGLVVRISRGSYRLSLRMWRMGSAVAPIHVLRDVAMPFLQDLFIATGNCVQLAVRDGLQTLCIEKLVGSRSIDTAPAVGSYRPLHSTAPGRLMIAFGEPGLIDDVISAAPEAVVDPDGLRFAVDEARSLGAAIVVHTDRSETGAVAAPLFGADGAIIGSVEAAVPASDFRPQRLVPLVRGIGRAVSLSLAARRDQDR